MGDAAHAIVTKGIDYSGHFLVDEVVLRQAGVEDLDQYAVSPGSELVPDFFL